MTNLKETIVIVGKKNKVGLSPHIAQYSLILYFKNNNNNNVPKVNVLFLKKIHCAICITNRPITARFSMDLLDSLTFSHHLLKYPAHVKYWEIYIFQIIQLSLWFFLYFLWIHRKYIGYVWPNIHKAFWIEKTRMRLVTQPCTLIMFWIVSALKNNLQTPADTDNIQWKVENADQVRETGF